MVGAIKSEDINVGPIRKIQVSPNWRFGAVWGYGFPFLKDALAIGPDIGLFIGTKRKFKVSFSKWYIGIEEQYLYIPFALKLATVEKETGVQEGGVILGCELNILLSSKVSLSGENTSKLEQLEGIAKSVTLGSSIFLGGKIDLFAGCYLMGQLKFPITDFVALKEDDRNGNEAKRFLHTSRLLGASCAELSLGVNTMQWL